MHEGACARKGPADVSVRHARPRGVRSRQTCSAAAGYYGIFFVFAKGLRAQRAGRVAPRRGGAKRRAAALGAAQRREAPPQAG